MVTYIINNLITEYFKAYLKFRLMKVFLLDFTQKSFLLIGLFGLE